MILKFEINIFISHRLEEEGGGFTEPIRKKEPWVSEATGRADVDL